MTCVAMVGDLEVAVSHEAQAVAVIAEGLGHGGDEGDAAPEAGHLKVLGHLPSWVLHNRPRHTSKYTSKQVLGPIAITPTNAAHKHHLHALQQTV